MKKLISGLMSACVAISSAIALTTSTANAAVITYDATSNAYKKLVEGYVEFDDSGYITGNNKNMVFKTFYNEEKDSVLKIQFPDDNFTYKIPNDENYDKAVGMAMHYSDWNVNWHYIGDEFVVAEVRISNNDKEKNFKNAADFARELKEITNVLEFEFSNSLVHPYNFPMETKQLTYCFGEQYDWPTDHKGFINYIKEKKLDYTIDFGTDYNYIPYDAESVITLIPNTETTVEERFKLIKQIEDDLGLRICAGSISESAIPSLSGESIDMATNVNGDANCDQKYSIADSTAILQALGNPDKYGLSMQGLFNADSTGDGLTVEDAVAIKTALAKGIE